LFTEAGAKVMNIPAVSVAPKYSDLIVEPAEEEQEEINPLPPPLPTVNGNPPIPPFPALAGVPLGK
jgi:hypothetical protein